VITKAATEAFAKFSLKQSVLMSAVEINNEKVTDLVCGKQNDLVEEKNGNFKVANLTFC
jgi:hypothetical protein